MPELPVAIRSRNFEEVATGFDQQMALEEANAACIAESPLRLAARFRSRYQISSLLLAGDPIAAGKQIKLDNASRVCGRSARNPTNARILHLNRKGDRLPSAPWNAT